MAWSVTLRREIEFSFGCARGSGLNFTIRCHRLSHNLFCRGEICPSVPQTQKDREFAREKIDQGLRGRTIAEVSESYAVSCVRRGLLISSSFTTWNGNEDYPKD